MDTKVISLLRARRRIAGRASDRQWHPVAGHTAKVIPFPQKIRSQLFAWDASDAFNDRACRCRHFTEAASPMPNRRRGHPCSMRNDIYGCASGALGV